MFLLDAHPPLNPTQMTSPLQARLAPSSSLDPRAVQTEALQTYLFPQVTLNNLFPGGRRQGWAAKVRCGGPWHWLQSGATITLPATGLLRPAQPGCTVVSPGHAAHSSLVRDILYTHSHPCADTPQTADHVPPRDQN